MSPFPRCVCTPLGTWNPLCLVHGDPRDTSILKSITPTPTASALVDALEQDAKVSGDALAKVDAAALAYLEAAMKPSQREQAWTLRVAAFGVGFFVGTIAMTLVGRF